MIQLFENILSETDCQGIIDQFNKDKNVLDDPQPHYSTRKYLNLSHQKDWLPAIAKVLEASNQIAEEYFGRPEGMEESGVEDWIDDGFIMAHYRKGESLILHTDGQIAEAPNNGLRLATLLFFMNECEGGELVFPLQNKTIEPRAGRAVIFPPDFHYPHQVNLCHSDRYIVQTWLTDPNLMVVPRED